MSEAFNKLDEIFNTDITTITDDPTEQALMVKEKTNALVEKSTLIRTLEDKLYLQEETKSLIENSKRVLSVMQNDIKIGSPPRNAEVYAKLLSSTVECIKELRELNKSIADIQRDDERIAIEKDFRKHQQLQPQQNNQMPQASINVKLTGKELLAMMKIAQSESQMHKIDTDFSVEGEPTNDR